MEKDARLFNCARCHQQTVVCSCCDRGNIYCSAECSQSARKARVREAGQRYQNTRRGKRKHAARQRRYRQRQKQKVTHQGSPISPSNDLLSPELTKPAMGSMTETTPQIWCHFCHKRCSDFVRLGFMRGRVRVQTQNKTSWPLGP